MLRQYVDTSTHLGKPLKARNREITPYSRATIIHIPGTTTGLVWNRPGGVLVTEADGSETALPVRDETRIAQIALLTTGLLGGLVVWMLLGSRK